MNWNFPWRRKSHSEPTLGESAPAPALKVGHDASIRRREEDDLDRWPVARSIHRTITSAPLGWSTRIGLYGPWGSGKTSVLNFLEQMVLEDGDIVVSFSAWQAVGESGVVAEFYDALLHRLKEMGANEPLRSWAKRFGNRFANGTRSLADTTASAGSASGNDAGAMIAAGAAATSAVATTIGGWLTITAPDLEELIKLLNGRRVVVFIDDLDRADPRIVPKTLLALRDLLDWPAFAFVLAFDKDVIAAALGDYSKAYGRSAESFLEKIIDVPFDLPFPTRSQAGRLATRALEETCPFIPSNVRLSAAQKFPGNPRQAKLIARSLGVLREAADRHDPGELDWPSMILQTVLRRVAPATSAIIESRLLGSDARSWLYFLPKEQKEKEEAETSAAIGAAGLDVDDPRLPWLRDLVASLVGARVRHGQVRIEYEMQLALREPCLTWKEFRTLATAWHTTREDALLEAYLAFGAKRANATRLEAALDLVRTCIYDYSNELDLGADSFARAELETHILRAERTMLLLEHFWNGCVIAEVTAASHALEICLLLRERFWKWVNFRENAVDTAMRDRELALMVRAARSCDDSEGLFFATDPMRMGDSDIYRGKGEKAAKADWLGAVRSAVIEPVVNEALRLFETPGGIVGIAATAEKEKGYGVWLFEAPASPLYANPVHAERLVAALTPMPEDTDPIRRAVLAKNAMDYLRLLTFSLRSSSWTGDFKEFAAAHGKIIEVAWRAAVSVEAQFRAIFGLIEVRKQIIEKGFDAERLPLPPWINVGGAKGD